MLSVYGGAWITSSIQFLCEMIQYDCQDDFLFDTEQSICNYPERVDCGERPCRDPDHCDGRFLPLQETSTSATTSSPLVTPRAGHRQTWRRCLTFWKQLPQLSLNLLLWLLTVDYTMRRERPLLLQPTASLSLSKENLRIFGIVNKRLGCFQ